MTVVVTGAAGHIGANLVRALLARGVPVRAATHRDRRALDGLPIECVSIDINDPDSLRRVFDGAAVVVHLASYISIAPDEWPLLHAVNVVGTRHVVEACLACGVQRLIYTSTIEALSPHPHDVVVDESRPPVDAKGATPYARSKAAAGQEVAAGNARGLDTVTLYPTGVIGPFDCDPSHFGQALIRMAGGRLPGLVSGGFNWVDARDVADGILRAVEHAASGSHYILGGHWVSVPDLAAAVAAFSGRRAARFVAPVWLAYIGVPFVAFYARLLGQSPMYTRSALQALQHYREVSFGHAARDLGYHPRPFSDTLADTLRWFESAGYLSQPLGSPPEELS
jgi:dihydroflavonol-4-reductase